MLVAQFGTVILVRSLSERMWWLKYDSIFVNR